MVFQIIVVALIVLIGVSLITSIAIQGFQFQTIGFSANSIVKDPTFSTQSSCCTVPWFSGPPLSLSGYNPGFTSTCGAGCKSSIKPSGGADGGKYLRTNETATNDDEDTAQNLTSTNVSVDANSLSYSFRNTALNCLGVSANCGSAVIIIWGSTGAVSSVFSYFVVTQSNALNYCHQATNLHCNNDSSACYRTITASWCTSIWSNLYSQESSYFKTQGNTITSVKGIFTDSFCGGSGGCSSGWITDFDLFQLGINGLGTVGLPAVTSALEILAVALVVIFEVRAIEERGSF